MNGSLSTGSNKFETGDLDLEGKNCYESSNVYAIPANVVDKYFESSKRNRVLMIYSLGAVQKLVTLNFNVNLAFKLPNFC